MEKALERDEGNVARKKEREGGREGGWEGGCWGLVWKISTSYKSGVVGMKLEGKVATRWGLVVEVATLSREGWWWWRSRGEKG